MDVRIPTHRRNVWVALTLLLTSCVVNPVPTPATNSKANDGLAAGGGQDTFAADTVASQDASAQDGPGGVPSVVLVTVAATATDAAITGGDHLVAVGPNSTGKLIVLLPEDKLLPTQYTSLATAAAQLGHRVLVLATPVGAQTVCDGDSTCLELVRQEMIDGQDRTSKVTVTPADCLQNRLVKALAWLDEQRPGEGWGSFRAGSTPVWSTIAVGGHGEGASEAVMLAMHHTVWRVILLNGPGDGAGTQPAPWLSAAPQTPVGAWRTLGHTKDSAWVIIAAAWTALGLGSSDAAVSVDGIEQPGISVHLLTTAMDVPDPHAAVAVDGALPDGADALNHLHAAWKILFWPF